MKTNFFVVDTNIFISAFLHASAVPTLAYKKAIQSGKIIVSQQTYNELQEVFLRPKFEKYLPISNRLEILYMLKKVFIFISPLITITACRDPKDNKFLELAVTANAACIITGDADLLELHPFKNIPILNAVDFLSYELLALS